MAAEFGHPEAVRPRRYSAGNDPLASLVGRALAAPRDHGPYICRLCGEMGGPPDILVSIRNIRGHGFAAFPCCDDRDACRERRATSGRGWPLIDASTPPVWAEDNPRRNDDGAP